MTILIYLPIGLLSLLLQSSLKVFLLPESFHVDVTLLITVFIAQRSKGWTDAGATFLLGYLQDVFSASPFGATSISLLIIFLLVHYASRVIELENPFTVISVTFLLEGVHTLFLFLIFYLLSGVSSIPAGALAGRLVLTALLAPVAFHIFRGIERRLSG